MILHVCLDDQQGNEEMRDFEVPDGTIPIGIGAECPHCHGFICRVDYQSKTFECCSVVRHGHGPWVQVPGMTHALPSVMAETRDGHVQVVHPYE